jgi:alkanesulfonate monooxygenase SsuD/methylene tetrahydromethanopterin reductase-like flavin-dependent oxidoreductase (luciferase family)
VQLPEVERRVEWAEVAQMARVAEAVGFDSLWVGDHLLYDLPGGPRGPWEAWTSLAALAAMTDRIALGPLVASLGFHAPAMLAKQAATVDAISGGRLTIGVGAGWNEREYRAFGFPFDARVARFEEAFTIVRRLLRGERVDHDGRYHRVTDCLLDPPPARPGGPLLMVGSIGPRMLRITLPHVAAWNAWYTQHGNRAEGFAAVRAAVETIAREVGRDPSTVMATAAVLVQLPAGRGRVMGGATGGPTPPVAGSSSEIADHLTAFAAAGAGHLQLVLDPITVESIETMGEVLGLLDRAGR